ncbi:MAG: hypothetical protein RLZZ267_836 [Bacillota bacterium]
MEFSLDNIKDAHATFTGVDFPKLIQVFKQMDMVTNTFNLQSGKVTYVHRAGEQIEVQARAVDEPINATSSSDEAKDILYRHQAGETDFPTFCREIAGAGVYKWVSNMDEMTCSYYDLNDNHVIVEAIPGVV